MTRKSTNRNQSTIENLARSLLIKEIFFEAGLPLTSLRIKTKYLISELSIVFVFKTSID